MKFNGGPIKSNIFRWFKSSIHFQRILEGAKLHGRPCRSSRPNAIQNLWFSPRTSAVLLSNLIQEEAQLQSTTVAEARRMN